MTDELAKFFASLYCQGYPTSTEEQGDETGRDQETSGTGMGEGAGMNDVSDQINDEDQLLGTFEKVWLTHSEHIYTYMIYISIYIIPYNLFY